MYTYLNDMQILHIYKAKLFEKAIDDEMTDEVIIDYWLAYWMNPG